jgi:hypothetical protein
LSEFFFSLLGEDVDFGMADERSSKQISDCLVFLLAGELKLQ